MVISSITGLHEDTWFGHPRGLYVLFFAEMWERFSFYGMRALLVLYLTQHFLFDDTQASYLYATYGSMVYLMPVIGGLIADRYLGFRRSITFGAILLVCGHALMAIEGLPAQIVDGQVLRSEISVNVLYLALSFIIVGVGFLKPSISSIVGQLYSKTDPRRDQGFTIFYMGINLGAVSAMLLCGWLGQTYGWAYGFGAAGIGMLTGLVTFQQGRSTLGGAGEPLDLPALTRPRMAGLSQEWLIYGGAILAIGATWWLIQYRALVGSLLGFTGAAAIIGVIWYSLKSCTRIERQRIYVVLFLTSVSVVFWTFFEQAGSSMTLFTERNVDREVLDVTMQASQLGFLNPAFIILLAPLFSYAWSVLAKSGLEPSTPMKFGLGVLQVGLGFAALVYGASYATTDGQVALIWLVVAYFLHTTGELCLSPVGLSMVTRLSTTRIVGMMMGIWFLSSAAASYVAGIIAGATAVEGAPGAIQGSAQSLGVYTDTFTTLAWVGTAVGLGVMLVAPFVRRYMHEDEELSS
ncbi:MAG: peptide MFS transporter [Proteobacteria bacterium]|nr:peptide MFS transporter [Pseudomonadota bacterium]